MKERKSFCTMESGCPQARTCLKKYDVRWDQYCGRAQLLRQVFNDQAPPRRVDDPAPTQVPLNKVRLYVDADGQETYYIQFPGGSRRILASPEMGYGDTLPVEGDDA